MTLKEEIIELVGLSATEHFRNVGFGSPCISIRTEGLIRVKIISELTKYVDQLFISILILTGFRP